MRTLDTGFAVLAAFALCGLEDGPTVLFPGVEAIEAAQAAPRPPTAKQRAKSRSPVRRAFRQLDLLGA